MHGSPRGRSLRPARSYPAERPGKLVEARASLTSGTAVGQGAGTGAER